MTWTTRSTWCDRQREVGIGIGSDLHRPVVGTDEQRNLPGQPLGRRDADARAGLHVSRVVHIPERAPARVDQDGIAVDHQQHLVDRQREIRIGIGADLDRPVVGADEQRILPGQPLCRSDADARAGLHVARVVHVPERAPAGVDQDGIARLQRQLLARQRLLQVLRRDLVVVREDRHALQGGDVDQHAAGDERADAVDAQRCRTPCVTRCPRSARSCRGCRRSSGAGTRRTASRRGRARR